MPLLEAVRFLLRLSRQKRFLPSPSPHQTMPPPRFPAIPRRFVQQHRQFE